MNPMDIIRQILKDDGQIESVRIDYTDREGRSAFKLIEVNNNLD